MCDNSVGVMFNDSARIVMHKNGCKLQYVDSDFNETFHALSSLQEHSSELKKRISIVEYFRKSLNVPALSL